MKNTILPLFHQLHTVFPLHYVVEKRFLIKSGEKRTSWQASVCAWQKVFNQALRLTYQDRYEGNIRWFQIDNRVFQNGLNFADLAV
jgi:hypothetical protein